MHQPTDHSAIKGANRQKHRPLNSYVSLDKPFYDDGKERTLMDMLGGSRSVDPENLIVDQEAFKDIEKKRLSHAERHGVGNLVRIS